MNRPSRSAIKLLLVPAVLFSFSFLVSKPAFAEGLVPAAVALNVPFTTQVPLGEWNDPRQRDGCEETSILMALMWAQGRQFIPEEVRQHIIGMSEYQRYFNGYFEDSSARDTANLMAQYFGYAQPEVKYDISIADIHAALNAGRLLIVPLNPRVLSSSRYNTATIYHTVVVVGYDNSTREIIFHDPLLSNGAYMRASEAIFEQALGDYPSGKHKPTQTRQRAMIVVSR